ncbi:hypothetical protein C5E19_12825 [Pectobacterium parmentieri]|nr:hypothetical protein C5E26_13395 [Pectobacterium parmentieri]AYH28122.1 hypothetical protein C5E20_13800 [Pectobacterium parmentieri]AYH32426.1 hypothetical protein C5E19_12825 [Pectobacterium parmentieri]
MRLLVRLLSLYPFRRFFRRYPPYFKLFVRWLLLNTRPKGPLQAAFKSAPGRFVTPVTYLYKFLGMK